MRNSTKWLLLGSAAGAAAAAAAAYGLITRPWHLRWGATDAELRRPMPFDDLIHHPNYFSTRAIDVEATPDEIWPFLIDMTHLPAGTLIRHADEKRSVLFAPPEIEAEVTWVVMLEPRNGKTRLISRNRARFGRRLSAVIRYLLVDPGLFLFERLWLRGLKARAEELAKAMKVGAPAVAEPQPEPDPEHQLA